MPVPSAVWNSIKSDMHAVAALTEPCIGECAHC